MNSKRSTKQRECIVRVIAEAKGPLSVQEILLQAQQHMPRLGIATVYRTLKLLQDDTEIKSVVMPTGEVRFERASLGHHHHFQCRVCRKVIDFDTCPIHLPHNLLSGYTIENHELTLYGVCPECKFAEQTC